MLIHLGRARLDVATDLRSALAGLLALLAVAGPARAQSQFNTPTGGGFAAGAVAMCIVGTGQSVPAGSAVPCGQYGTALATSSGGGGGGGSVNITQWASTLLGVPTAWGTAPSGNVPGVNANVLALPPVSVSNFPATQQISAASLPLPPNAATASGQAPVTAAGTSATTAAAMQGCTGCVPLPISHTFLGSQVVNSALDTAIPGTSLNALASGSYALGAALNNVPTSGAVISFDLADLSITLSAAVTTGSGSPYLTVWILPSVDGINYPTPPGATAGAGPLNLSYNCPVLASTSTQTIVCPNLPIPPYNFKVMIENVMGVTLPATNTSPVLLMRKTTGSW